MRTEFEGIGANNVSQNIMRATIQLAVIKAKKSPIVEYMRKSIKREVGIEEVRDRLAKITASMSEEIIEGRAERT